MSKFTLFTGKDGQTYWNLKAANGEIIGKSEGYTTKSAAENGIASTQKNAADVSRFEFKETSSGKWMWNLKASNGQVIMTSQPYSSKQAAEGGMESAMKNAPSASTQDDTKSATAAA